MPKSEKLNDKNQIATGQAFKSYLQDCLPEILIGREAHLQMTPTLKGVPFRAFEPDGIPRQAAVLILFDNEFRFPLTLRNINLSKHAGEISFPGGRSDEGENAIRTALREAWEEIDLPSEEVEIIGELSRLYIPHSNNMITPVVGYAPELPPFIPNPDEVDRILIADLFDLAFKNRPKTQVKDFWGKPYDVPFFDVGIDIPLWGATAMILSEILNILRDYRGCLTTGSRSCRRTESNRKTGTSTGPATNFTP